MSPAAMRSFNHRTILEQHLAAAERHIVEGRERILQQRSIIARLEFRGIRKNAHSRNRAAAATLIPEQPCAANSRPRPPAESISLTRLPRRAAK